MKWLLVVTVFFYLRIVTIQMLWGWFVTPVFAVAAPSFAGIVGLMMLVFILTPIKLKKDESEKNMTEEQIVTRYLEKIFDCLVLMGMGYALRWWT